MIRKIFFAAIAMLVILGFVACDSGNRAYAGADNSYTETQVPELVPETETYREFSVDELGDVIIQAGTFWEDWWNMNGIFVHTEWLDPDALPAHILDTRGMAFLRFLPESGFASLDDVREYLARFYTQQRVDELLNDEFSVFIEYDGTLFVDATRTGFPRPKWDGTTHVLIEQDGSRAVVETTFLYGSWHRGVDDAYGMRAIYRFVFEDGLIAVGIGPWGSNDDVVFEELPPTITQLGRVIEAEIRQWENFWYYRSPFASYHIEFSELISPRNDGIYFARVAQTADLPTMEFLLGRMWNYTDEWTERFFERTDAPFVEHNGALYINTWRDHIPRPHWESANHVMIEQDGLHSVVETTVGLVDPMYAAIIGGARPIVGEAQIRFTFVGRQIDYSSENFPWFLE